jgi:hypothetical protein
MEGGAGGRPFFAECLRCARILGHPDGPKVVRLAATSSHRRWFVLQLLVKLHPGYTR